MIRTVLRLGEELALDESDAAAAALGSSGSGVNTVGRVLL